MKLEEAIIDLLLRHNCVVVPAFGGFIAQSTGAVIDMQSGVMLPPRKSVLFNRQLINNDGLLISHLSTEGGMNYDEAEKILTKHVVDWHSRLQEGQRVSIDKIGHLYLDAERNISFEQDRFFNLLLQSYGLNKVHFITEEEVKIAEYQHRPEKVQIPLPVHEEEKIDFSPREIPISPMVPQPAAEVIELNEEPKRRKIWKYAIAAALIPFAFYTYWIPMQTNVLESGMISFKDFNPMYNAGDGVYQLKKTSFPKTKEKKDKTLEESVEGLRGKVDVYSYKFDDDLFIPVKIKAEKIEEEIAPKTETLNSETSMVETLKTETHETEKKKQPIVLDLLYDEIPTKQIDKKKPISEVKVSGSQYIVGAYSSVENAQKMVDILRSKGMTNAKIVDTQGGLTRVSAGGSENIIEMDAIIEKAEAAGYKGWTLK